MTASLKIAIVGAGPAGCTLARLLLTLDAQIDITVYEGESSVNARAQGGTLDLHNDTGLAAIHKAGLYDEFLKHARFDGESLQIADKTFRRWLNIKGSQEGKSTTGRPEIDRSRLRQILVDSLPSDMIKWNHRLRSVSEDDKGRVTLHFDNTTASGFDLVVGADGAWSKIRPLVSDVKPFYSGIGGIRSQIPDAANTHPDLYEMVRQGSLFTYSDHKSLMMQQLGDGNINIYTWVVQPPTSAPHPSPEELKEQQLRNFQEWDPRLKKFLEVAHSDTTVTDLYMLPVGHSWKHKRGLTLIGDASHVMTPFAGEGVNLGMKDSLVLAGAIVTAANKIAVEELFDDAVKQNFLSKEIIKFEQEMFVRAKTFQQLTWDSLEMMFLHSTNPGDVIEKWVYSHAEENVPRGLKWLLFTAIYSYYFVFRLMNWGW